MNERSSHGRRGASLVLLAIMFMALIGFAGLSVDVGYWYYVQARLQGLSDAMALAACINLPDRTAADAEARNYGALNRVAASEIDAIVFTPATGSANQCEVRLHRYAGPFFTAMLSILQVTVATRSVAIQSTRGGSGGGGGLPAGLTKAMYAGGTATTTLCQKSTSISGNTQFNGPVNVTGASNSYSPGLTSSGTITGSYSGGRSQNQPSVPMPELDPNMAANARAAGNYYKYVTATGAWQRCDSGGCFDTSTPPSGATFVGNTIRFNTISGSVGTPLYIENGNAELHGSSSSATGSIVAEGKITITGASLSFQTDNLAFVSLSTAADAISVSAESSSIHGFLFAPNGTVMLAGKSTSIDGGVAGLGVSMDCTKESLSISYKQAGASKVPFRVTTKPFVRLLE